MREKNKRYKSLRWLGAVVFIIFVLLNVFSAIQAYSCTHLHEGSNKPKDSQGLVEMLVFGVEIPKPQTLRYPDREYEIVKIDAGENRTLSAWVIKTDSVSKGTFILFHGYIAEKSMMLDYAYQILDLGYDVMLVDFMGSGNSYGKQTTIGYRESENVKSAFDYTADVLNEENIYLLGFSMGAAAVIKAQHDYDMNVKGIVAEASYSTLFNTIKVRLGAASFMSTPLAYMFSFWGGMANDMDVFAMNPEEYAKSIHVPVLIACGGEDQYIPQSETQRIYDNLATNNKLLKFYPECKHETYLSKYPDEWRQTLKDFLNLTQQL